MKLFIGFFALLFIVACSTSEHTATDPAASAEAPPSAESQADQVGSVPEDMLANETGGNEESQAAESTDPNDPFADLKSDSSDSESIVATPSEPESLAVIEDGESAPVADSGSGSGSGEMSTYTVKSGDTLMKIAFTIYGDLDRWQDLRDWNSDKIKTGKMLRPGMQLRYETPADEFQPQALAHAYTIKKGDTLGNIADEVYGRKAKYKKLQRYNAKLIKNPNRIFAGFTLYYDITQQEVAEAEARRKERMAQKGDFAPIGTASAQSFESVPSAISPPVEAVPVPQTIAQPTPGVVPVPAPEMVGPAPAPVPAPASVPPPTSAQ